MKKKIYFAGGWFTAEQEEEHSRLYELIKNDYDVFNPKLESLVTKDSSNDFMKKTLIGNINGIDESDIVVAIYDGKDTGTIWETGYAYSSRKPIVYYAEKLNGKNFNLMLAKTGWVATNEKELLNLLNNEETYYFHITYDSYKGDVE